MNRRRLLQRIQQGSHQNISYSDLVSLIEGLGFHEVRTPGSHHIFKHPSVPDFVNLQAIHGQAKSFQVRQIMHLIRRYNLSLGEP